MHFRRRRSSSLGTVIKSYKKVLFFAPQSIVPGITQDELIQGVDSLASGQANQTDSLVPTGVIVKALDIQFNMSNTGQQTTSIVMSLQHLHAGQSIIDPRTQGGNPQRNQVFFTKSLFIGENQQVNTHIKFKIPKKYQRVREGDKWTWVFVADEAFSAQNLIIYKTYS